MGWYWLIGLYRFQVWVSMIQGLPIALCAHHPKSYLLPSPYMGSLPERYQKVKSSSYSKWTIAMSTNPLPQGQNKHGSRVSCSVKQRKEGCAWECGLFQAPYWSPMVFYFTTKCIQKWQVVISFAHNGNLKYIQLEHSSPSFLPVSSQKLSTIRSHVQDLRWNLKGAEFTHWCILWVILKIFKRKLHIFLQT